MKCLLVADIHYSLKQFDWINQAAEKFDVVIIAGDLLDIASTVNKEAQIVVVLKYLRHILPHTKLLVSSGNHDGNGTTPSNENVARWLANARALGAVVDGDSVLESGVLFSVCPWRDGPGTSDDIFRQLESDSKKERKQWVWIYHEPPQGCPVSWNGKTHFGDDVLLTWIDQFKPDMIFSGHVHQAPFRNEGSWVDQLGSTWVFNMGQQIGPIPSLIAIDLAKETAVWLSQAGKQLIELSKPFSPENIIELA